jgi:hypothetical protein
MAASGSAIGFVDAPNLIWLQVLGYRRWSLA